MLMEQTKELNFNITGTFSQMLLKQFKETLISWLNEMTPKKTLFMGAKIGKCTQKKKNDEEKKTHWWKI